MARALWKGAISFGLVNIPVELHPAEDRKAFKFSMLDKRDLSPVGYKRFSKTSGEEVPWENVVKGYEYEKDRYVVLSDEDFRQANVKATQTIDIRAFVSADEIPVEYYETPYYLAPSPRGHKAYALLRETLKSARRVAVAEVVLRTTPHLAIVVPNGRALMLDTLRFRDELRDTKGLELPPEGMKGAKVTAKEIDLAKRLVDDMTEHWNAAEYHNTYHDDLMARIRQKIKQGRTTEITEPERSSAAPRSAQVIDLAALLKRSLAKGTGGHKTAQRRPPLRTVARGATTRKRASAGSAKTGAARKRA
jgi:DNA end-binding protein Ku